MSESNETVPQRVDEETVRAAIFARGEESEKLWAYLLSPANGEVTVAILTTMITTVNNDLATRSAKTMTQAELREFREWRHRALGFKSGVERRLIVAKAVLRTQRSTTSNDRNLANRESLRELACAVRDHQAASLEAEINPEEHDIILWRYLDTLHVPVGDQLVTLSEMLDNGTWSS